MAVFVVYSCIGVICELPSLNYSNCGVNPTRFSDFITYLVVVVRTRKACFGAGLRLIVSRLDSLPFIMRVEHLIF
jgi:hypothetical protein